MTYMYGVRIFNRLKRRWKWLLVSLKYDWNCRILPMKCWKPHRPYYHFTHNHGTDYSMASVPWQHGGQWRGGRMTIKELYERAVKEGKEDYIIEFEDCYNGVVEVESFAFDDEYRRIILYK